MGPPYTAKLSKRSDLIHHMHAVGMTVDWHRIFAWLLPAAPEPASAAPPGVKDGEWALDKAVLELIRRGKIGITGNEVRSAASLTLVDPC